MIAGRPRYPGWRDANRAANVYNQMVKYEDLFRKEPEGPEEMKLDGGDAASTMLDFVGGAA